MTATEWLLVVCSWMVVSCLQLYGCYMTAARWLLYDCSCMVVKHIRLTAECRLQLDDCTASTAAAGWLWGVLVFMVIQHIWSKITFNVFFTFVESGEYKTDATASWRCTYIPLLTLKIFTYSLLHFRTNFPLIVWLSVLHLLFGEGGEGGGRYACSIWKPAYS